MGFQDPSWRPASTDGDYDHRRQRVLRFGGVALAVLMAIILVQALI